MSDFVLMRVSSSGCLFAGETKVVLTNQVCGCSAS